MQVQVVADKLVLSFAPSPDMVARVKSIEGRRYDAKTKTWTVPYTTQAYQRLQQLGWPLSAMGIDAPTRSAYRVELLPNDNVWAVFTPFSDRNRAVFTSLPDSRMWDNVRRCWLVSPTPRNATILREAFPELQWPGAVATAPATATSPTTAPSAASVADFTFPVKPWAQQRTAFSVSRGKTAFFLSMEMRTGKSGVTIWTAADFYARGTIRRVLVLCPNTVVTNWPEEIALHTPASVPTQVQYKGQRGKLKPVDPAALSWLIVNVEALSSAGWVKQLADFCRAGPTMVVLDESTRFKNFRAARTKALMKVLRPLAVVRRCLSGMATPQGPLDLFTQYYFLDPDILGFSNWYTYRNHICLMGGWEGREILGYAHLDEVADAIAPHTYRVTLAECSDMPRVLYQKRHITLAPAQRTVYEQMAAQLRVELEAETVVTAQIVVTKLLRLQQIVGGFLPHPLTGIEMPVLPVEQNPKFIALLDELEDFDGKAIIWSWFRPELRALAMLLRKQYGHESVVEIHGGIAGAERKAARLAFQDPSSPVRWCVGQQGTGGLGINLSQAKAMYYVTNSFDLEARIQSEFRGQHVDRTTPLTIIDLVATDTVDDELIFPSLRGKLRLFTTITKENWKEWL